MRYIANILTPKTFSDGELYNIVNNKDDLIEGIPTLIIGWEFAHKLYPEANILDWKINEDMYWTFGNREKRDRYDKCVKDFRDIALNRFIKSIKYTFFNILASTDEEKASFSHKIKKEELIAYISGNMVYLYNKENNEAIGVSLMDFNYGGYNRKKFFATILNSPNITSIDIKEELSWVMRMALKNCNYVIPSLFS